MEFFRKLFGFPKSMKPEWKWWLSDFTNASLLPGEADRLKKECCILMRNQLSYLDKFRASDEEYQSFAKMADYKCLALFRALNHAGFNPSSVPFDLRCGKPIINGKIYLEHFQHWLANFSPTIFNIRDIENDFYGEKSTDGFVMSVRNMMKAKKQHFEDRKASIVVYGFSYDLKGRKTRIYYNWNINGEFLH